RDDAWPITAARFAQIRNGFGRDGRGRASVSREPLTPLIGQDVEWRAESVFELGCQLAAFLCERCRPAVRGDCSSHSGSSSCNASTGSSGTPAGRRPSPAPFRTLFAWRRRRSLGQPTLPSELVASEA